MKISILLATLLLLPSLSFANKNVENEESADIGLASIWAIGKLSHGGFIKADAGLISYDNDLNSMWSIHGGWRFSKHIKLGFSLAATLEQVDKVGDKLIAVGPTLGYTNFNRSIGRYSVDLSLGAAYAYTGESGGTAFIEPGFYLINRFARISPRKIQWTGGISYRKFENIDASISGNNDMNSINLKFGLLYGAY